MKAELEFVHLLWHHEIFWLHSPDFMKSLKKSKLIALNVIYVCAALCIMEISTSQTFHVLIKHSPRAQDCKILPELNENFICQLYLWYSEFIILTMESIFLKYCLFLLHTISIIEYSGLWGGFNTTTTDYYNIYYDRKFWWNLVLDFPP